MANTLAYCNMATITAVKGLKVKAVECRGAACLLEKLNSTGLNLQLVIPSTKDDRKRQRHFQDCNKAVLKISGQPCWRRPTPRCSAATRP